MTTSIVKKQNGSSPAPARSLSSWVDQLFQDNLNRFFNDDPWFTGTGTTSPRVPVNLKETSKTYEMELVAPGLKKEDFKIQVSNDSLTVSFEHSEEEKQGKEEEGWIRREYRNESFSRTFHLDDTVDAGRIEADYNNGILHVCLPKKENAQKISRSIEVR
jgi:HSP20 family protein